MGGIRGKRTLLVENEGGRIEKISVKKAKNRRRAVFEKRIKGPVVSQLEFSKEYCVILRSTRQTV